MNFIDNIEIKNFKSIRHQKIEGCKKINVFIGYPNVGKSNILEALSGFSLLNEKLVHNKSLKTLIRFSRFSDLFFNADISNPISITINKSDHLIYNLTDLNRMIIAITGLEKSKNKDLKLNGRREKTYFNCTINADGNLTNNSEVEFANFGKAFIKKYSFKADIEFTSSSTLSLNMPYGDNLNDMVEINPELRKECNEVLKDYNLNLHFDRTKSGNKLELRRTLPDGTTITLDWNLIADTLRRLFFYKAAILSNRNTVLLFEEPEAHLFPRYISKLTGEIILNENNNQYFMASHSPYVLNDLISGLGNEDLALFIVSYNKEKAETVIQKMTESEVNEAYQFGYDFFMNINNFIQQPQHE